MPEWSVILAYLAKHDEAVYTVVNYDLFIISNNFYVILRDFDAKYKA